jgi:hypothetical protein
METTRSKSGQPSKVGEWPQYDRDLGADRPKWSSGIRKMILLGAIDETNAEMLADYLPEQLAVGAFRAEDSRDERMIEDFQLSGLGVNEFLKVWQRV